jgi:hypothetical protein
MTFKVGDVVVFTSDGQLHNWQIVSFSPDGIFVNLTDLTTSGMKQVFVSYLNLYGTKVVLAPTPPVVAAAGSGCLLALPMLILRLFV